jgi:serine/threonine protein kinase
MGCCITPPCVITEFMQGGSLYDALHERNVKLDPPLLLKMAKDIAEGMLHLHNLNILVFNCLFICYDIHDCTAQRSHQQEHSHR